MWVALPRVRHRHTGCWAVVVFPRESPKVALGGGEEEPAEKVFIRPFTRLLRRQQHLQHFSNFLRSFGIYLEKREFLLH